MKRTKSTMTGWVKVGRKHHRHTATGIELKYNHNTSRWQPIGGPNDGAQGHATLWLGMYNECKTAAQWA